MKLVPLVLPILLLFGGMPAPADDPPEARFAAMSPAEVRAYERETLRRVADLALVPPVLNTEPLPQYDYDKLDYGMTIGIERTPKGRIWACWVAGGDSPKAFFVLATSDDDGETWSKPRLVVDSHAPNLPRGRSILVGNLWTDPQGRLWLFFDQSMEMFDGRAGLWASVCENPDAEKPAWSPPRRIWHGVMLNKPTVLSTGEWMLPVSLDQRDGSLPTERGMFGPFQRLFPELDPLRGANVLVSADRGKTWERRGAVRFPNPDWHEHMIVERRDKSLWMLARTEKGIMQSTSTDGGRTWAEPTEPPGIRQPNARFHVRRLASGKLLLVKHGDRIDAHEGRVKLSAWLSDDDGATWQGGLVLDERPGISYPDGFQAPDGTIFISYDRNRATDGEILLARFTEADVLARQLTGPKSKLEMLISRPLAPRPGARPAGAATILPSGWDPKAAADAVLARLVRVSEPQVKGAHDAEFVCVGDRAYVVEHDNDVAPGHGAGKAMYCVLTVVDLKTLAVEKTHLLAKAGQAFTNATLPDAEIFVPRIIRKDEHTLRCWFCSQPATEQAVTWYRDFDLRTQCFAESIHKAKLKTAAGVFDMEPRHFHADAAAQGFAKPPVRRGLYIFDSFKEFDGRRYVALNNFEGRQNALAVLLDDFTFEVLGHYNEPQAEQLSESAVNRLPDGTWMAICRNERGNYHFTTSKDGRTWTVAEPRAFVPNGLNSKPTFDRFGGVYYLGWQENTRVADCDRSVFNVDVSRDGKNWERKYRFESPHSFQYPTFHEHEGTIWLAVTQSDHKGSSDRIMFGKVEEVGRFESQQGAERTKFPPHVASPPKPWTSNRGEKLYNGIVLPEVWPPAHLGPASADPMPVPYLEHPPKVIPIDVGRQLFVDDFLVESSTLKRTFHTAKKYEGNPVFKAATELELRPAEEGERGERATTFLGQGGVFYDPAEKHFKMFYVAGWRGPLSLATSTDMIHWRRPELGLAGGNALLPRGLRWTGPQLKTGGSDNCVWLDLNAPSPAERIKFITCWLHVPKEQRPQGFMHSLHVSDGKTWSDAVPTTIAADDYCSFFYNPFRGKWCFSIKRGTSRGRSRYYLEDADFLHGADWSQAVYWTSADNRDAAEPVGRYPGAGDAPQLYSLNAVAYESLMVGMHYIHRGPGNEVCEKGNFPKLTDLELGFSRDGFHWDRPDRRGFIVGSRTEGSWDRGYLHGTAGMFVVLDDQLIFPYMGASGMAPDGYRGMYTGGAIGLAMLRRDGFASLDAGEEAGTLTTRPVVFRGSRLFVNVAAPKGALRVEALDEAGKVVATSKPVFGDSTKQAVAWVDRGDLSDLAGRPIRFRFHLTHGSFYSFWVTSDAAGASNGYVGAGGPEFAGVRDVAPRP